MKTKEILVPVSFSESSVNALQYCLDYAKDETAGIYALHMVGTSVETEDQIAKTLAGKVKSGRDYKLVVRDGDVPSKVLSFAREVSANLIVLSTTGPASENKAISPVTSYIANNSPVPVLIIPAAAKFSRVNKILIVAESEVNMVEKLFKVFNYFDHFSPEIFILFSGKPGKNPEQILNDLKESTNYNQIEVISSLKSDLDTRVENLVKEKDIDIICFQGGEKGFAKISGAGKNSVCIPCILQIPILVFPELLSI
jgi:nucleotide-binding universal stress UspA family protein